MPEDAPYPSEPVDWSVQIGQLQPQVHGGSGAQTHLGERRADRFRRPMIVAPAFIARTRWRCLALAGHFSCDARDRLTDFTLTHFGTVVSGGAGNR
jgi:hypothetical protein